METVFFITISLSLVLVVPIIFLLVLRMRADRKEKAQLAQSLKAEGLAREKLEQKLNIVLKLTHEFSEARDEKQIIDSLISMSIEMAGASGASFVPLDENGQPRAAIRKGDFPFPVPDAWLEYLASQAVRSECQVCANRAAFDNDCPLIRGPFSDVMGVYCFSLRYGESELGILNIYLPGPTKLDPIAQEFINAIAEATALALESERLRHREIETLSHLSQLREKQDLDPALSTILEDLAKALNADFSFLALNFGENFSLNGLLKSKKAFSSEILGGDQLRDIEQILKHIFQNQLVEIFSKENTHLVKSWLGIPVSYTPQEGKQSWLLLASSHQTKFSQRQIMIAQSVAEKLVLYLNNADFLVGMEFRIMMEERRRLAREIHDGLAQTLGFLKLQIVQIMGHVDRDDRERIHNSLHTCYDALAEAYQDARLAIDGLRVNPTGEGSYNLKDWLTQTAEDYSEHLFDLKIDYDELHQDLPPEIHAQLIRIVQEALSNIRKHAQARSVLIVCTQKNRDFILEIHDDGIGFTPDDIPKPSRYGLKGMRERSDLLGADFQIVSRPGNGTTIRVRIPLEEQDWMEV